MVAVAEQPRVLQLQGPLGAPLRGQQACGPREERGLLGPLTSARRAPAAQIFSSPMFNVCFLYVSFLGGI